ncbi:MAG TPA: hypothetical protein VFJ09_02345 [Nocardioidaceae bacterium]|nr:hypothetical protein [Nocardioidaceae bacterium]
MSDSNQQGGLPPDLPPEYAEAYRRGYQRAYEQAGGGGNGEGQYDEAARHYDEATGPAHRAPVPEPTTQLNIEDLFSRSEPASVAEQADADERPAWMVPTVLAVAALALILGAYAVGRAFSSSVADNAASKGSGKLVIPSSAAPSQGGSSASQQPGASYSGATDLAHVTAAGATCQSADAFDAGGNKVSYQPGNVFDQDMSTAWRCNGSGRGEVLTLTLDHTMPIGQVGLVPGYAKTDPYDGANRYAENDRITKVRWTFSDGSSVVQKLDGSAHNRGMQTMRIPVTRTSTVKMTILDTVRGPRDTVAVSEVRIGRVVD